MEEVEGGNEGSPSAPRAKGRGQKRLRYYDDYAAKTVATLDVHTRCPEEDPTGTERRRIRVYIVDRVQVWLDLEDVEPESSQGRATDR